LELESENVRAPVPVGAIDIVPPVVASVPANPAGVLITRSTSAAEFPESTVIADAPVAVIDELAAANGEKVMLGALICTGPPPFMTKAVPSATVKVLFAAVDTKVVVSVAALPNVPVPPTVKLFTVNGLVSSVIVAPLVRVTVVPFVTVMTFA